MNAPFFDPSYHLESCRCHYCEVRRDPTGRIWRTLVVAIVLVLVFAFVVGRLG